MSQAVETPERVNAEALIREAFDRARRGGKANWHVMTTAVLKNRLLQISNNSFSIADYGVESVVDFARMFPDLVEVTTDPARGPSFVTLVGAEIESGSESAVRQDLGPTSGTKGRLQVRQDLWRAVMDWNDGHRYVIDPVTGRARQQLAEDTADLPIVSGISKATYVRWRLDFIARELEGASDQDTAALTHWRESAGPSRDLPSHLQDDWMTELRTKVVAHIREWFDSVGLPVPSDLTREGTSGGQRSAASTNVEVAVATQRLRDLVRRCVDSMSYEELQAVHLPASVVARALSR